jgi:hypothetical protein
MPPAARRAVEELFLAYLRRRYPTVSGRSSGQANEASGRVARGWGGRPGASPRRFYPPGPRLTLCRRSTAVEMAETDTKSRGTFKTKRQRWGEDGRSPGFIEHFCNCAETRSSGPPSPPEASGS